MDWRYIAGFIDGEGTISARNNRFRITITQTNKEVLEAIRSFTQCGNVVEITKRKAHWKDSWVYFISKRENIHKFLIKIFPYLIVKKAEAGYAISKLKMELIKMKQKEEESEERKHLAKLLRNNGWSYRKIGKKLRIDWGYARRLILDIK